MLQVTGFGLGRVDYASTYPLLGPDQHRRVIPVDADEIRGSARVVLARMQRARIRFAYVTAVAEDRAAVERLFAPPDFRLIETSAVEMSGTIGARRPLFRPTSELTSRSVIRYVFELDT